MGDVGVSRSCRINIYELLSQVRLGTGSSLWGCYRGNTGFKQVVTRLNSFYLHFPQHPDFIGNIIGYKITILKMSRLSGGSTLSIQIIWVLLVDLRVYHRVWLWGCTLTDNGSTVTPKGLWGSWLHVSWVNFDEWKSAAWHFTPPHLHVSVYFNMHVTDFHV